LKEFKKFTRAAREGPRVMILFVLNFERICPAQAGENSPRNISNAATPWGARAKVTLTNISFHHYTRWKYSSTKSIDKVSLLSHLEIV